MSDFLLPTLHTLAELDFGAWYDAYIWRSPTLSLAYVPASHAGGNASVILIGRSESHKVAANLSPQQLRELLQELGWRPGFGFPALPDPPTS